MHLRYDEDFVEAAVLLCARGRRKSVPPMHVARFNRERDRLYAVLDPDERNAAFFRLHLEWFREWGLEELLIKPLGEFPGLTERLNFLAFRKSRARDDDGAELYVNETGERNGVVAMRPERLEQGAELLRFLRHEFMHLHDMVDPAFGYRLELPVSAPSAGSHRLARERYRLLWDVTIDGRLSRSGKPTMATRDQHRLAFARAFPFWTEPGQEEVFNALWTDTAPCHDKLAELACDPRGLQSSPGPRPGAACPLCGFPTFAWADAASLADDTVRAIQSEFPHWAQADGACARCASIYHLKKFSDLHAPNLPVVHFTRP